ncbi:MalY/PatB family protein [Actinomadura gamaensis]|uniref:cysteine-S-conjugate beta-lyase n=1 Tax=Actinomadura gamaensis TaxID=1763541 RepID=A0ABV9TXY5_9ACTN
MDARKSSIAARAAWPSVVGMFDDIDRKALGGGIKWGNVDPGVLPAWIADMDFPVAPPIREAVQQRLDYLGYPRWDDTPALNPLRESFAGWMQRHHSVTLDPSRMHVFTELIQALQVVLHLGTRPGDLVAMHCPAYPPFLKTIERMGRRLLPIPMTDTPDGWAFDPERAAGAKALVLVNPHNPTGRVMSHAELSALAEVAERDGMLVVSDEIHADLTYEPHRHVPFASLLDRTITLSSASKAFNLAGLRCSVAHIGDARVRDALAAMPPQMFGEVSSLSVAATVAAWQQGDQWLDEARRTLTRNRDLLATGLPPGVRHHTPEATYLAWLDCRALDLGTDPAAHFLKHSGVRLSPGPDFGPGGEGFARLNFATGLPVLQEILHRLSG